MKVAILDMYNDKPGQHGMRCLHDILREYAPEAEVSVFNVRAKVEIPDLSYDLYISSGGPGDPTEYDERWSDKYFNFIDQLEQWNKQHIDSPKYLFAICHSFQLLCAHKRIGAITARKKFSFGVTAIRKTDDGKTDDLLKHFDEVFYAADHRYFQVVDPDFSKIEEADIHILAKEECNDDNSEDSLMVVRFSPHIIGTQFHPEVDVLGMKDTITKENIRLEVEKVFGKERLVRIQKDINDPQKIDKMYHTLLPQFIHLCKETKAGIPVNEPMI